MRKVSPRTLADTMSGMSTRLIDWVEKMPGHRVALVGDFMLDRYIFGRTERISPEGPIPILRFSREEQRLGGAGFVHAGLAALGTHVNAVGVIGNDPSGEELRKRLHETGANVDGLVVCDDRPTVTKTRLLGSSEDKTPQQMIRLDEEYVRRRSFWFNVSIILRTIPAVLFGRGAA